MFDILRKSVPRPLKRATRKLLSEFPVRLRDTPADIAESFINPRDLRLPPARLRYRVADTSDRDSFLRIGQQVAEDIAAAVRPFLSDESIEHVLDFGVGCGRVARHTSRLFARSNLTGVDVDEAAVDWCQRHLRGTYLPISTVSTLPFADSQFDLIYAVSVFTHLSADAQTAWLTELRRTLRPSGLLLITTLSPALTYTRPDMTESHVARLRDTGFVYLPGTGPFNENTSFQSREYLRHAPPGLELVHHATHGVAKYQDLALFRSSRPNFA